jgi:hypothetical protein
VAPWLLVPKSAAVGSNGSVLADLAEPGTKHRQRIAPSEPIDVLQRHPIADAATAEQVSSEARPSVDARVVNGRPPVVAPAASSAARSSAAPGPDRYGTDWYRLERH